MRLKVERLGHRGDGIAAGPVYVAGALPGETVEGEIADGRMDRPTIVMPSAERVQPDCPNYGRCGGCSLMHASDPFVGRWKVAAVRDALKARGIEAPILGIATSPPGSRRRAVLTARRVKGRVVVGFHARRSEEVVGIEGCRVVTPSIEAALPLLARMAEVLLSGRGELALAVIDGPSGLDISVSGGDEPGRDVLTDLTRIAAEGDVARLSLDGDPIFEARAPFQSIATVRVVPPPGAFLQATSQGEAALIACVSRAIGDASHVADLFSGCGTFALPLSRRVKVHAVEGAAALLSAADAAWRQSRGHRAMTTEVRDLFADPLSPDELAAFDAIVMDPPRAGAEAQSRALSASSVPRVAAVSCNPDSFARDARILADGGYELDWVRVVDQFRWSPHVELAASFRRQ